jgi:hypothetical protein
MNEQFLGACRISNKILLPLATEARLPCLLCVCVWQWVSVTMVVAEGALIANVLKLIFVQVFIIPSPETFALYSGKSL